MNNLKAMTDQELHEEMRNLLDAVATRSSTNWEADRRKLDEVVDELEGRGYEIG